MQGMKIGVLVLLGLATSRPVGAANAMAQARATVVEAVSVSTLLGSPLSVNDILAALQAAAGPQTGSVSIRLAISGSPSPVQAGHGGGSAWALAEEAGEAGTLQRELVAAVSAIRHELAAEPPSITVAFN